MTQATPDPLAAPRRRRWPWVLVALLVVVGALVALDLLGRQWAEAAIADRVADALDASDAQVEVEIGGGPLLLQLATGRLAQVELAVDDLEVGPFTGELDVVAEGVPLDLDAATTSITARYLIPEAALENVSSQLTGVPLASIALDEPEIVVSGSVTVLAASIPFGLGIEPDALDGALAFRVTSLRIANQTLPVEDAVGDPVFGSLAEALLQQQSVCVADQLPAALELSGADVVGDRVVLEFDASGEAVGSDRFSTRGSCT
ncbi:DUF2993 domain-containing protein [Homoserinibacter sp. GY 40078]|uniref:LmeA family phospholipid-binding protein n=1 Tax=Homoserinibacter sp. GY 40078 TaxID=2603275 RepID=UPI0011CB7779|nr:DUF2993 domain-containing protein [Homoserinibacter sp. GY 40078]TXK17244.1 DUF2993 domain-containing protein [Homoserinibacter sp. GY 40078]